MDVEQLMEINKENIVNIDIGTKLYLTIEGVDFTVNSIFVGMKTDEYLIITPPTKLATVKNRFVPGNSIIVKYMFNGTIYAFQSSVIEVITKPIKIIAIQYPKLVQHNELRSNKRLPCFLPASLELLNNTKPVLLSDLNKKGCRFEYHETDKENPRMRQQEMIKLSIKFPGVGEAGLVGCRVQNVRRKGKKIFVGVEFSKPSERFIDSLAHYLFSIHDFL